MLFISRTDCNDEEQYGTAGNSGIDTRNVGLGSADGPAAVAENRRRAAAAVVTGAALVTCYQIHSADVVTVTDDRATARFQVPTTRPSRTMIGVESRAIGALTTAGSVTWARCLYATRYSSKLGNSCTSGARIRAGAAAAR